MSGVEVRVLSVGAAREAWVEHRFFKYRGCAGHPDDPQRMAGNPELLVGAHHGPDAFTAEGQKERRAREDPLCAEAAGPANVAGEDHRAAGSSAEGPLSAAPPARDPRYEARRWARVKARARAHLAPGVAA